jgi:pimeloyl-ACP methyl ester carboxylesterase
MNRVVLAQVAAFMATGVPGSLATSQTPVSVVQAVDPSPHTQRFIDVGGGVRLEVLDWGGSGRPIVLLSQLSQTAHTFDDWAPRLAKNFHVVGLTRRGFGASSTPSSSGDDYSLARLGQDVTLAISALHLEKPILVGLGVAGDEVTWVGGQNPVQVAGLVYLDAAYHHGGVGEEVGVPRPPAPQVKDMESVHALYEFLGGNAALPESELWQVVKLDEQGRVVGFRGDPTLAQQIVRGFPAPDYSRVRIPALAIYAKRVSPEQAAPGCRITKDQAALAACSRLLGWLQGHLAEGEAELRTSRGTIEVIELSGASPTLFTSNETEVTQAIVRFAERLK